MHEDSWTVDSGAGSGKALWALQGESWCVPKKPGCPAVHPSPSRVLTHPGYVGLQADRG